jgi:glycine hydroxymethyltransferase
MPNKDFLFRGELDELDPDVAELIRHETARQARHLILIPSESTIPGAVREALGSAFHNIYAEGYPLDETRAMTEAELLDYNARLPEYRRSADKRYYKGTAYANMIESLARRRAAELFATPAYPADRLFVNVQPLSGAPANNAIYTALLSVGDTVMGMDLFQGGHLTHGSPVNRSGINYRIVSYGVNPDTERLDYDQIMALALEHRPKMIIAGYSSYPFAPDFQRFRAIADAVGAYLLADIAHVAGLAAAGVYPNPVGIADIVNFTTHKTLAGPRGAVIITHRADLSAKIDRAVFPGEQGGPHINSITALAVALRLARTDQFRALQQQTVRNAVRLAEQLAAHGLRIPHGGTDTHLLLVDCRSITGPDGTALSGDMAARILELAGIVVNRQTIPGDTAALRPSGLRLGTPWITQRGFHEADIDRLAQVIADLLQACVPFSYSGRRRPEARAKVPFAALEQAQQAVYEMAASAGIDTDVQADGYPHFYEPAHNGADSGWQALAVTGPEAAAFLNAALTSDVYALTPGQQQPTWLLGADGAPISQALLERADGGYKLYVVENAARAAAWLRALSDGFVLFDPSDPYAKVPGPVDVRLLGAASVRPPADAFVGDSGYARKAYAVGLNGPRYAGPQPQALPPFEWTEDDSAALRTTPLHSLHRDLGAKMVPFAGYDMPVWYTSVTDEHLSVRGGAGLFDVTHMGVFDAFGPGAEAFLNAVTTNDVSRLAVGESHYTYLLAPDGLPLDDLMIYKLADEHFMLVVNASNNDKNWAWLNAVKAGRVQIDADAPGRRVEGSERFTLRDLRDAAVGADQRVDIALQGPQSRAVLLALGADDATRKAVEKLAWAGVLRAQIGAYDLIISRTGYTGERIAFELFVHPNQAAALFRDLVEHGATPCGLAARDSLRTEAGLPLYGHELAGPLGLNPADAGFSNYVKLYKPFFVGKAAYIAHEQVRDAEIARFRVESRGARPPHQGDPLLDAKGRVVGTVTSCSIDSDGYQLGQAYVKLDYTAEGTPLAVFAGAGRAKPGKPLAELALGDRFTLPEPVVILSRFPKAKKK